MIYIASPYSSPQKRIREYRYEAVRDYTIYLIKRNLPAYSPILYMHELAKEYNLSYEADFWKNFNWAFFRKADSMHVLQLEGWELSTGVQMEVEWAYNADKPLKFVTHVYPRVD